MDLLLNSLIIYIYFLSATSCRAADPSAAPPGLPRLPEGEQGSVVPGPLFDGRQAAHPLHPGVLQAAAKTLAPEDPAR